MAFPLQPPVKIRKKKRRRKKRKRNKKVNARKCVAHQPETTHNADERQLFVKESTEYKKKKTIEYNEEAGVFGKGKVGKKTKLMTYVIGLIPTIIAMSLTYLSEDAYKKLTVAGGTMTLLSPIIIWTCQWSSSFANITLGKYHREKARRISRLLTRDHAEYQSALEEGFGLIYDVFHNQIEDLCVSNPMWREDIQKLAIDAVDRIFNYLDKYLGDLEPNYMLKGVIYGKSKLHLLTRGYSVIFRGSKIRTGDLFSEVDVHNEEDRVVFWKNKIDVRARCGWRYMFEGEEFVETPVSTLQSVKIYLQRSRKVNIMCVIELSIPTVCLILLPMLPNDKTDMFNSFSAVCILFFVAFITQLTYIDKPCGDFAFAAFIMFKLIALLANIGWMITAMTMIALNTNAKD